MNENQIKRMSTLQIAMLISGSEVMVAKLKIEANDNRKYDRKLRVVTNKLTKNRTRLTTAKATSARLQKALERALCEVTRLNEKGCDCVEKLQKKSKGVQASISDTVFRPRGCYVLWYVGRCRQANR